MEAYERYTQDIGGSPRGKSTGAFFDFDGTIIASHSVMDIFIERLKSGEIKSQEIFDLGAITETSGSDEAAQPLPLPVAPGDETQ